MTSEDCELTLSLQTSAASQHRAACGEVRIVKGEGTSAPATIQVAVSANDNSGSIRAYRVDWGDGSTKEELTRSTFEHVYDKAGSYPVVVAIKDSLGEWREGTEDICEVTARVGTAEKLVEQPQTGVGLSLLLSVLVSGVVGGLLLIGRYSLQIPN